MHTLVLPAATGMEAEKPCAGPAFGKAAPTSGRLVLASTTPASVDPLTYTWTVTGPVVSSSMAQPSMFTTPVAPVTRSTDPRGTLMITLTDRQPSKGLLPAG